MPTYAILGGTGQIGSELVEMLSTEPDVSLRVYARSESKLLAAHPILQKTPHKVFGGDLTDVDVIARCIEGAEVIYGVVGTNANNPNITLAQDMASSIIHALSSKKAAAGSTSYIPPTVVFISSSGASKNPEVRAAFPKAIVWVLHRVGKYIYLDFNRASELFERPQNKWIPVIMFCAPGIMPGPSQGDIFVTTQMPKKAPLYVTYTDLARGMILSYKEREEWIGKDITVIGAKMPPIDNKINMYYFLTGLMCVWFPPLWRFGHRRGWWGDK